MSYIDFECPLKDKKIITKRPKNMDYIQYKKVRNESNKAIRDYLKFQNKDSINPELGHKRKKYRKDNNRKRTKGRIRIQTVFNKELNRFVRIYHSPF